MLLRYTVLVITLASCAHSQPSHRPSKQSSPAKCPKPAANTTNDVVPQLIRLIEGDSVQSIQAALALRFYGQDWGVGAPSHSAVVPALLDCAQDGTMREVSVTCMNSLKAIGESILPTLSAEIAKEPNQYYLYEIYAEVLPVERFGELVPYYVAACVRFQEFHNHGDDHIASYVIDGFRRDRAKSESVLRAYSAKRASEVGCVTNAISELAKPRLED